MTLFILRQDNADLRLTHLGHSIGLATEERLIKTQHKIDQYSELKQHLEKTKINVPDINNWLEKKDSATIKEKTSLSNLLKRPEIDIISFEEIPGQSEIFNTFTTDIKEQVSIQIKYDIYIKKQFEMAQKMESMEDLKIIPEFDYAKVKALSSEARQKLINIKPETIGQASRISGVSPADISVLMVYLGR